MGQNGNKICSFTLDCDYFPDVSVFFMLHFTSHLIFREAYPDLEVQDVQFAYDIKALIEFDKDR